MIGTERDPGAEKTLISELSPQGLSVCGVDLGGRRARLCLLDPTDVRHPFMVRIEPDLKRHPANYVEVARWAAAWAPTVWAQLPDLVCVWFEEPRGASNRAIHQLSLMAGALLAGLPREVGVEMVTAGEARKLNGLSGNLRKERAIEWATLETDADFVFDQHDADAYVVARAILAHGERQNPASEDA